MLLYCASLSIILVDMDVIVRSPSVLFCSVVSSVLSTPRSESRSWIYPSAHSPLLCFQPLVLFCTVLHLPFPPSTLSAATSSNSQCLHVCPSVPSPTGVRAADAHETWPTEGQKTREEGVRATHTHALTAGTLLHCSVHFCRLSAILLEVIQ